jgi:hypothetical protein
VNTQITPFGNKLGIEELQELLQFSEPTQSLCTRQVRIQIPTMISGEKIPEDALNSLPGVIAIAEFYRIVGRGSSPPSAPGQGGLDAEGISGKLPGGGSIHLQVNYQNSPVTATIGISEHNLPGYEQVKKIEFVLSQISGSSTT